MILYCWIIYRKSREKARQKAAETKQRVDGLKTENVALEHKVDTLKVGGHAIGED